jgi:hypothetical protein
MSVEGLEDEREEWKAGLSRTTSQANNAYTESDITTNAEAEVAEKSWG